MSTPEDPYAALLRLRASIDNIDAALVYLLAERFRATQQVGQLKAQHDMPASDPDREARQVARLRELGADTVAAAGRVGEVHKLVALEIRVQHDIVQPALPVHGDLR